VAVKGTQNPRKFSFKDYDFGQLAEIVSYDFGRPAEIVTGKFAIVSNFNYDLSILTQRQQFVGQVWNARKPMQLVMEE
jgi:hypothetical protein